MEEASRDLSTLVAIDFPPDDKPERCAWCPGWRLEWVDLDDETTVLREWHLPDRHVAIDWADD